MSINSRVRSITITDLNASQWISDLMFTSSTIFCKYKTDEYQSAVLNSYGVFQPMGPNFLRS